MSIVTERKNHDLPVSYCTSETESELSSDSENFKGYLDKKRSKSYSAKKNSSVIGDSSNASFDSTQEIENTDNSFTDLTPSRKRRRTVSSSEESLETRSRSISPEITYGGSPVKYKLCKVDGTLIIIKKSMSSKPSRGSQKCTDSDINVILNLDSDSEDSLIFDGVKNGTKIVGSRTADSKYSEKNLSTPSKTESLKREDVSLRIKFRRSTEQSNYKIERNSNDEETKCRTLGRSTRGTPKKCGTADCDEDRSVETNRRIVTLKSPIKANFAKIGSPSTPKRTRKNSKSYESKNLHNKENESEIDENSEEDNDSASSRGREMRKIRSNQELGTPAKQVKKLDQVDTPSSGRPRRNSRLVNYNYDTLDITAELDEANVPKIGSPSTPRRTRKNSKSYESKNLHNKENESEIDENSEEDNDSASSRGREMRKIRSNQELGTPAKQVKKLDQVDTPSSGRPRRNSRLVNYNYDTLDITAELDEANVPKIGSPSTPRRTRKNSKSYESKNLHNKENESEIDENSEEDNDSASSRGREMKKIRSNQELGTPVKQVTKLDQVNTPSSGRPRRNSRLVNYNYDALDSMKELNEAKVIIEKSEIKIEAGTPRSARARKSTRLSSYDYDDIKTENPRVKDNDSDNDADSVDSRGLGRRKLADKPDIGTPRKQIKKIEECSTPSSTRPRRNSRLVSYNYAGYEVADIPNYREYESDECSSASRRRSTRRFPIKEGSVTPQKQMKILEEPMSLKRTPRTRAVQRLGEASAKRTPRKTEAQKLEEATPMKTLLKSAMKQLEDEPPMTPTRSTRKISKATTPPMTPTRSAKRNSKATTPSMTPTATRRISKAITPSMKNGSLTPSMSRRTANVGKPKTILEEARAQLHVSAVPKSLPCREVEFNDIFEFLQRKLWDNNGGCIYISGVPGTGKTATVNEAIRCLKKLVSKGDLENFDFIEINGMKLSEPRQAYVQILKQMNGKIATWEQAYEILEKRFTQSTAKRPMTLLLVDELDLLCNKRQDVVYNLLDWPAKANAQLVVITIANTMDLPERVLMGRVTSRLGLTRLTFQPYNHKQLQEIVMARLKDSDAFKSEAIQLVARKVAAVSGDARRALDICRRATEIAELNSGKIVTMQDVNQALTEMIASAKVQAIKHCSQMERIFLQAVCAEVARTGVEEASFHNVYRQLDALCSFEGLKVPNITQALGICGRLGGNRLLLCEHSRTDTQQRILLNVSSDDIHFAMQTIDIS